MTEASSPTAPAISPRQLRWLMGGLMVGMFLSSIEQSVVATALPTIAGELGSANQIAWVVSIYLLTSTIVTPLYGKMSDLFGRRIVYQTSISVFLVGSILCAIAPTMELLVAARAVQGVGGVIPPPEGWLARIREICDRHDILLVAEPLHYGARTGGTAYADPLQP